MKAKEYFYDYNFLTEILASKNYNECNKKELNSWWHTMYCFFLKKYYKAKNTAIDYCNKVAYLQFDNSSVIEDDRLSIPNSRIVELHYPDLKTLLFSVFRKNRVA
ncbi:MAG TPA: hypothetical protein VFM65_06440 [Flavobacteriaceae bacterium]|nr:hypothetical protein [Flavobacteriaceae bacterium]